MSADDLDLALLDYGDPTWRRDFFFNSEGAEAGLSVRQSRRQMRVRRDDETPFRPDLEFVDPCLALDRLGCALANENTRRAVVAFAACGSDKATTTTAATATTKTGAAGVEVVKVDKGDVATGIIDFDFEPKETKASIGQTVLWTHKGKVAHTVTGEKGAYDSGRLTGGGTFAVKFTAAGTYFYACTIHPAMQASIVVG